MRFRYRNQEMDIKIHEIIFIYATKRTCVLFFQTKNIEITSLNHNYTAYKSDIEIV